ncbi:flagellar protein FlgN [Clostridium sp.]|uniref:flagellar protein FlgN n=1 Tax=Clostridium sp. TaxID=1506 RepID=UPI002629E4AD|nr:flagellar protein FlgN [Clostridium sp.]
MIDKLIKLIIDQEKDLRSLLELLEIQNEMIVKKDLFGLEGLIDKFNVCSKKIAEKEVERRKLLGESSISEVLKESDNDELKQSYNNIRNTLNKVLFNKETNEILLKQNIIFNTKMLNIMNPSKTMKTYNSYGHLSK